MSNFFGNIGWIILNIWNFYKKNSRSLAPIIIGIGTVLGACIANPHGIAELIYLINSKIFLHDTSTRIHWSTQNKKQLEEYLNKLSPDPNNVSLFTSANNIHVWTKGIKSSYKYTYKEELWSRILFQANFDKNWPNYFFKQRSIIPIGFIPCTAKNITCMSYLEVQYER